VCGRAVSVRSSLRSDIIGRFGDEWIYPKYWFAILMLSSGLMTVRVLHPRTDFVLRSVFFVYVLPSLR